MYLLKSTALILCLILAGCSSKQEQPKEEQAAVVPAKVDHAWLDDYEPRLRDALKESVFEVERRDGVLVVTAPVDASFNPDRPEMLLPVRRFRILANMVQTPQEGRDLFAMLVRVTDHFLDDVVLDFLGAIPFDDYLRKSVKRQRAVVEAYPRSKSAFAFMKVAQKIESWPMPRGPGGYIEFFVERLVHGAGYSDWDPYT